MYHISSIVILRIGVIFSKEQKAMTIKRKEKGKLVLIFTKGGKIYQNCILRYCDGWDQQQSWNVSSCLQIILLTHWAWKWM